MIWASVAAVTVDQYMKTSSRRILIAPTHWDIDLSSGVIALYGLQVENGMMTDYFGDF
jgi:hypothetical protein